MICSLPSPTGSPTAKTVARALLVSMVLALAVGCKSHPARLSRADPAEVGIDAEKLNAVDEVLARYTHRHRWLAGVNAMIVRRGRVVYEEQYGSPMQPDTMFRICSMTKPITSVAIMILVEAGALSVDDPLSKFVPQFDNASVLELHEGDDGAKTEKIVAAERSITIRHLLTHTSGLTYRFLGQEPWATRYKELEINGGLTESAISQAENARRLAQAPLVFQPGTRWNYSLSTDVLGHVVEVVSGQTLEAFFRERIFAPLGMVDSSFRVPSEKASRLATIYQPTEDGTIEPLPPGPVEGEFVTYSSTYPFGDSTFYSGGGGLVSTVRDYARFAEMLRRGGELGGVRILEPETVAAMTRDQCAGINSGFPSHGDAFGFGFGIVTPDGAKEGDAAAGTFSWGGFYYTYFWVDPEREITGVIMAQLYPWGERDLWNEFRKAVYATLID